MQGFEGLRALGGRITRMVKLRDLSETDLPEILRIQTGCSQAAQWRGEDYARLLADQASLVLVAALETAPGITSSNEDGVRRLSRVQALPGSVAGFVVFHRVGDEAELRNFAVAPAYQRRGIGRLLLEAGQQRLREAGVRQIYLEVRTSNHPALALYSSLGYRVISVRKEYYRDLDEDAQVLSMTLSPDLAP